MGKIREFFVVLLVAVWGYVDSFVRSEEKAAKITREGSQTTGKVTGYAERQVQYSHYQTVPSTEVSLTYEYEANVRRFTGTQVVDGDLAKRPIGSEIKVWYLPESPDQHVIAP